MLKVVDADNNSDMDFLRRARRHIAVLCKLSGCGN